MGVTKQSTSQKLLATETGDSADRFIDTQKTPVGIDFGNANGGVFVSGRKPLVLLERMQTRTFECGVGPLARRDVEKAIDRSPARP